MSHLSIFINDIPVNTSPDASLDIEDKNPLFNDEEMFSYPIEIPFATNREITKSLDSPQAGIRPVDLEHSPMRVLVDGLPFRSGTAVVSDGEELESAASVSMEAAEQSFSDLISDLKCTDIPLIKPIKIGEKIGKIKFRVYYHTEVRIDIGGGRSDDFYEWENSEGYPAEGEFTPQALGFSQPFEMISQNPEYEERSYHDATLRVPKASARGQSFINVSEPYDYRTYNHPYCNSRVCYKHRAKADDGSTSDSVIDKKDSLMQYEDLYPYWVLDAERPQSGICFYVLYFLECLFTHLGMDYDLSAIAFGDFLRLCFFTTKCKYTEELNTDRNWQTKDGFGCALYTNSYTGHDEINAWLDSYGCGGHINVLEGEDKNLDELNLYGTYHYVKGENHVRTITVDTDIRAWDARAQINNMYATSDNFPEMTVQSLIDSLENQFGIKFYYDYQRNKVTAYLLRDVFRSQASAINFAGTIDSIVPISEKITGVRIGYSDESDIKEQRENVKNGVKDYDTSYDYIDYPEGRTVIGTDLYKDIFGSPNSTDMNVYIDLTTGNKYRIKIDSDYTNASNMFPVLFEVGQFKGVEEGDCSAKNEDFIKEMKSDFQPLPLNDVNYYREKDAFSSEQTRNVTDKGLTSVKAKINMPQPILVPFMDEDMEHEFIMQRLNSLMDIHSTLTDIYLSQELRLVESYDPSGTDDGNSPLQTYDWGNAIAIMRGGGNDSELEQYDYGYDGFDNSKWKRTVGVYALSTDLVDQFGNVYDYNGTIKGLALEGAFSLKPRSYVMPDIKVINRDENNALEKYVDQDGNLMPLVQADSVETSPTTGLPIENGDVIRYKSRGYVDTFLSELIYFYLHRKYFKITVKTTAAALADIPNHWRSRWNIGGITGFIDKVSYSISQQDGIQQADIYLYAI